MSTGTSPPAPAARRRAAPVTAALVLLTLAVPAAFAAGDAVRPARRAPAVTVRPAVAGPVRAGAGFFALPPVALLHAAPIEAGETRRLQVAGASAGVPGEGAAAVAVNVELAAGPDAATATLFPAGTEPAPGAVTVAAGPGGVASAFSIQRLSATGALEVRAGGGRATVTVRVRGYYAAPCGAPGATWRPAGPTTVLDTTLAAGAIATAGTVAPGADGGPGLEAVALAIEATGVLARGRLQVRTPGLAAPDDATLALAPGRAAGVVEVARPGPDGGVGIVNQSPAEVRVRVRLVGRFARGDGDGAAYQAIEPEPLLDASVRQGAPVPVEVAGLGGLPAGSGTVTADLGVVATGATVDGRLAIATAPGAEPAATVGIGRGGAAAMVAFPRPDADGRVWLSASAGSVRVRVWARGWFGTPAALGAVPDLATSVGFDRRGAAEPGWTGGSVSAPIRLPDGSTAWLFAESFLGVLRPDGSQPPATPGPPKGKGPMSTLVHNSIVVQSGAQLTTHSGPVDRATGFPGALLRPERGGADRWYWPSNGLVEGGALRVFVHEFRQLSTGAIRWMGRNRTVSLSLPGLRPTADSASPGDDPASPVQRIQWGDAVLEEASHTYVYGTEELEGGGKRAHVARFPRGRATGAWRFWDGDRWVVDPAASTPLGGVGGSDPVASTPGTVARLGAGYVMLSVADFGRTVDVRTSCAPTGPWGPAHQLYRIPELPSPTGAGDIAFLARGYPVGDGLLVAYSLSTDDLGEQMRRASYYRPRYLRVR